MKLFIRIKDGLPFEHPLLEENVRQVWPDLDFTNLPEWIAPFNRRHPEECNPYMHPKECRYELVNGIYSDVWYGAPFSEEEIRLKQERTKIVFDKVFGFKSWNFNEVKCRMEPPVPYPDDGKYYKWNETSKVWVESSNFCDYFFTPK